MAVLSHYLPRPSGSEQARSDYPAANMGELPLCELVDCDPLDEALGALSVGDLVFKTRDTMWLGASATVSATLLPKSAPDSMTVLLAALQSDTGARISMHRVRYGGA